MTSPVIESMTHAVRVIDGRAGVARAARSCPVRSRRFARRRRPPSARDRRSDRGPDRRQVAPGAQSAIHQRQAQRIPRPSPHLSSRRRCRRCSSVPHLAETAEHALVAQGDDFAVSRHRRGAAKRQQTRPIHHRKPKQIRRLTDLPDTLQGTEPAGRLLQIGNLAQPPNNRRPISQIKGLIQSVNHTHPSRSKAVDSRQWGLAPAPHQGRSPWNPLVRFGRRQSWYGSVPIEGLRRDEPERRCRTPRGRLV